MVSAQPSYVPEQSNPANEKFVWSYEITIINESEDIVQLLNRFWRITDMTGKIEDIHGAGVVGLPSDDVGESRRIDTHGADYGPVLVGFGHAHGRHEDQPVRVHRAGLVHLGAGDIDALVVAAHDVEE